MCGTNIVLPAIILTSVLKIDDVRAYHGMTGYVDMPLDYAMINSNDRRHYGMSQSRRADDDRNVEEKKPLKPSKDPWYRRWGSSIKSFFDGMGRSIKKTFSKKKTQ